MNPNREEALFALALEKPASERSAFLKVVCGDDDSLRQRLDALLVAHEQSQGVLAEAVPSDKGTLKVELDIPDETVGQKIGRYKILEKVGEGGCGVVYVAEQTEPVRRRVALKVIKLGMDTKQVVARFEAERQALAMMDHPNIAKVLDAGSTEQGRPYFIMELVRGIRITDYCDQNNLATKDRLDLFIQVCHAIQHAHQKGIIHRDIKPSNILVTLHDGVPVPKVIDFGIAKATEGRLTDATVYTQLHQFIGTPASSNFRTLAELYPNEHLNYHALLPLLAQIGDIEMYRHWRDRALKTFTHTKDPAIAERITKDCLILPDAGVDMDVVEGLEVIMITLGKTNLYFDRFQFAKGLAEYRQGHFEEAVNWLQAALPRLPKSGGGGWAAVEAQMVLAMSLHQLKRADAARRELESGAGIAEKSAPISGSLSRNTERVWADWIIAHVLIDEARALIEGQSSREVGATLTTDQP